MKVLPASMPSAARKSIVIVGPSLRRRCTAMPMATSAARIGISQTADGRRARLTTIACGSSAPSGGGSTMLHLCREARVPDQALIEGMRGEHGQDDHRHEVDNART